MNRLHVLGFWGLVCFLAACSSANPYIKPTADQADRLPDLELEYQVFLVGNAGVPTLDAPAPALDLLHRHLQQAPEQSALVFLGDNLYPAGLPDSTAAGRPAATQRLQRLINLVDGYPGRVIFTPGDRDWANSKWNGLQSVRRQEAFVEATLDRGNTFLPDNGFPGPHEVELTKNIRLVVLDTQWWLTPHARPYGDAGDYEIEDGGDVLLEIDDIIRRHRDEHLLVVGHHPLYSNGPEGGYFPIRRHFLPLPLIGSGYTLYRSLFGRRQDLSHPRYSILRKGLKTIFERHEGLVYAAAHGHSLQYFKPHAQHYLVSGAAVDPNYVASGRGAVFTASKHGYLVLYYYTDGSVWLEAHATEPEDGEDRVLFRQQLEPPDAERVDPDLPFAAGPYPNYADSARTLAPNPGYKAGALKSFFLGSHRRDAWATEVEVPYLDMGVEAGGLTPVKRGGGLQTTSLRLEGADGHEYVLRSVDKDPGKALSANLQQSLAAAIARDQTSSQHPFGAYLIPPLAEAAGIYHTHPKMVYVPHDPRLGVYEEAIGGLLMLFEERPDDDMSDAPHFGRSKEVVGAPDLYRNVNRDNDHIVDQRAFARARLFDMLISDWDRHIDQWRWATFEQDGKTLYRPIPRDRDQAFNRMNGVPGLVKPFTKWQDFRESYGVLKGLTYNGREQDHRFTAALSRSDWIEIADTLKTLLTDDVVEAAFKQWPGPIYDLHGPELTAIFKHRRDQLPEIAERFYRLHAQTVDLVASHKHERFEITHLNDQETEVVMYKTSKEGEIREERYRRRFHRDETQEIRLYGLDGQDRFLVSGPGRGVKVRAIGGPGEDTFLDESTGGTTRYYDGFHGNTIEAGPRTQVHLSDDPALNSYDNRFEYDLIRPTAFFDYHQDDGLFLGGGVRITRQGFRKVPYARQHTLAANASMSGASNLKYGGHFVQALGKWDLYLDADALLPGSFRNFYGLGNETTNTDADEDFYRARITQFTLAPALLKHMPFRYRFTVGPVLEFTRVKPDADRFLLQAGIADQIFDAFQYFAGAQSALTIENRDHPLNPKLGYLWANHVSANVGLGEATETYLQMATELSIYASPSASPQITFAGRVGMAHTVGDFPFYRANTLGSKTNLRGYASTRFAGRTSAYQNLDLRLKLFNFSAHLATGELGLLGFFDNGRVWTDGEDSDVWHHSYGGGVWVNLFERAVLVGTVGISEEATILGIRLGFMF